MVQSSRSRALIALISGCDAPYNRCMCMPGGAGTSTTSKISARHRSHLPDHSNAQPGRHRRLCSHRGLARSSRCFWAVSRSTIVEYVYPVVLVPRQHRKSVTGIVHTSRTIQTRNQAVLTSDGGWTMVQSSRSHASRAVQFGLFLVVQSLHVHIQWWQYPRPNHNPI